MHPCGSGYTHPPDEDRPSSEPVDQHEQLPSLLIVQQMLGQWRRQEADRVGRELPVEVPANARP